MPRPLKPLPLTDTLHPIGSMAGEYERNTRKLDEWAAKCGDARARAALRVWERNRRLPRTRRSNTLPELLTEAWLTKYSPVPWQAQVELVFARPDFVLFPTDAHAWVWRVQGDYWHSGEYEEREDAAQKAELLATEYRADGRARRISRVIDLWESDIYASERVFEEAASDGIA